PPIRPGWIRLHPSYSLFASFIPAPIRHVGLPFVRTPKSAGLFAVHKDDREYCPASMAIPKNTDTSSRTTARIRVKPHRINISGCFVVLLDTDAMLVPQVFGTMPSVYRECNYKTTTKSWRRQLLLSSPQSRPPV